AAGPPVPPLPQMTSVALRLPAGGPVVVMVVITASAVTGAERAQFAVSAVITGGRPGTVYDLTGNACSDAAPQPDHVWATGLAGADGTAELAGHPWTGAVADRYWLGLSPAPGTPPPYGPVSPVPCRSTRFADGTSAQPGRKPAPKTGTAQREAANFPKPCT